jgi:hypothetical protein
VNYQSEFARYDSADFWNKVPWGAHFLPARAQPGRDPLFYARSNLQGAPSRGPLPLGAGRPGYYLSDARQPASALGDDEDQDATDDGSDDGSGGTTYDASTSIPSGAAATPAAAAGPSSSSAPATAAAPVAAAPASSSSGSWFSDLMTGVGTAVKALAPSATTLSQQQQLAALNAQRALQGLPPLTSLPGTVVAPPASAPMSTTTMLMLAAAGLGLVVVLASGKRR